MNWIVAALAVFAAIDVAQRVHQVRAATSRERVVVGAGLLAAVIALSLLAAPLLAALDISAPNIEIGAGVVLAVYSIVALVMWDDTAATSLWGNGVVPFLFPIVLTPAVGAVTIAVAARNGLPVPIVTAAVAAVLLAWTGADAAIGRRPLRAVSAAIGVVTGVVMIVDGAFAV